jgi:DNA (cytosine-5)-methyltransferase 1
VRYGTLCSGIETASLAFPKSWKPIWFSEVDPFCCALLKERYPHVPNLGDLTKIESAPSVDLVIAGKPCQSFSEQGSKRGLDDPRGQLALQFSKLLDSLRPKWIVWENVPGVLQSNRGRDFRCFLSSLAKLRYGLAYRVLDAQFFGVPQRRRRVFVVGHHPDWRRAAAVLFDGPQFDANAGSSAEVHGEQQSAPRFSDCLLGWTGDETPKHGIEVVPTLRSQQGGEGVGVIGRGICRKLTTTERERLQGIPDGYTDIAGWPESKRRNAIGNAFCVNVIRWIANRIEEVRANDGGILHGG